MKDLKALVEDFFEREHELNIASYAVDSTDEWQPAFEAFKTAYLLPETEKYWFKIPVSGFSPERRKQLLSRLRKRKYYLLKRFAISGSDEMLNVFCSNPTEANEINHCFLFSKSGDEIKLCHIETVCDDCFISGYLDEQSQKCTGCNGRGFKHSKNIDLVNWKTVFYEAPPAEHIEKIRMPSSPLQQEALLLQTKISKT